MWGDRLLNHLDQLMMFGLCGLVDMFEIEHGEMGQFAQRIGLYFGEFAQQNHSALAAQFEHCSYLLYHCDCGG